MHKNYVDYRIDFVGERMRIMGVSPLDCMITGVTGAGKSSTLNSLFSKEIAQVGTGVDPETKSVDSYMLNDELRFWDTPGLGDGVYEDKRHAADIIRELKETYGDSDQYGFIDIVLVIIEAINRDMGTTFRLINDIILPNIQSDRVLVALNQADMAMKGYHWDYERNSPDDTLKSFLNDQSASIRKRVHEATGLAIKTPCCYSATKKYNIEAFLDFIIDNIPRQQRNI